MADGAARCQALSEAVTETPGAPPAPQAPAPPIVSGPGVQVTGRLVIEPLWRFVRRYLLQRGCLEGLPVLFIAATGGSTCSCAGPKSGRGRRGPPSPRHSRGAREVSASGRGS